MQSNANDALHFAMRQEKGTAYHVIVTWAQHMGLLGLRTKKKKKNYTWYSPRERRKGTKKKIGLDRRPKGLDAQFKSNSVLASFLSHWMTVVSSLWNIHGNNTGSYAQQRCPGLMSPIALVLSGKTGQGEF